MENKIEVDITKWIEYCTIGKTVTNYRCPVIIDKITEYNDFITLYIKNIDKCISVEKTSFLKTIKEYLEEYGNEGN